MFNLLNTGNYKTIKGEKAGYQTFGIHLAPSNLSGYNVCPFASAGCKASCLNTAGRGLMKNVQAARVRKAKWHFEDPAGFFKQLEFEIAVAILSAKKDGLIPVFRLNLTSDLNFLPTIAKFPDVQFYDYTKRPDMLKRELPANYHITFSRSEKNELYCRRALAKGISVAVVFGNALPATFWGYEVVSGDENDLRFLDKKGVIVGLSAKGKAKKDHSKFVINA